MDPGFPRLRAARDVRGPGTGKARKPRGARIRVAGDGRARGRPYAGVMRARTSISVTFTGLGVDTLASGVYDGAGSGVAELVRGDADLRLSIPRFDRSGGGGTVEQRIVSGVVFTKLPAAVVGKAKLPATVRWLSLDPRPSGADRSALAQSQVDPAGTTG